MLDEGEEIVKQKKGKMEEDKLKEFYGLNDLIGKVHSSFIITKNAKGIKTMHFDSENNPEINTVMVRDKGKGEEKVITRADFEENSQEERLLRNYKYLNEKDKERLMQISNILVCGF